MRYNHCVDCSVDIDRKSKRCRSCANKGKNNPIYGKISHRKNMTLEEEYGEERANETRRKISDTKKGTHSHRKGITWKEEYGEKRATTMKRKYFGNNNPAKKPGVGKKISKAKKGHVCYKDPIWRRKISEAGKGRVCSEETREKLSGKNHHNWQNGKSFEPYGIDFDEELKEKIRIRDGYRCQECFRHQSELRTKNNRKYKLHVHHIDYCKTHNTEDNLISLCHGCHSQTNYKRKDWTKYYQNKIKDYKSES